MQSDTLRGRGPRCRYRVKAGARTPSWGADWSPEYARGASERRIGPPIRSFGDARATRPDYRFSVQSGYSGSSPASRRASAFSRESESTEPAHLPRATPEACQPPAVRDLLALRQDFEQLANLPLLDEGMPQGKLGLDLVAVPPALSLAQHVALFDELGEDPVGSTLGDAYPQRR